LTKQSAGKLTGSEGTGTVPVGKSEDIKTNNSAYHGSQVTTNMNAQPAPQLVAHRGFLKRYPENTWRDLEAALKIGAKWLEFDIQLCRDGVFVLLHDDNFFRTARIDRSVFDLDSTQIDFSVPEPQRFGHEFEPTPLPALAMVLQWKHHAISAPCLSCPGRATP
jgi:glycerophosphoryl diester phosphodiesterase